MRILGIDPGLRPGYCIWDDNVLELYAKFSQVPPGPLAAVVTEDIWHGGKAPPATISKLAFTCGLQVMRASKDMKVPVYRLPVREWKDAVVYRGGTLPKDIFIARLRKALHLSEKRSGDQVEAAGITVAWIGMTLETRELYRVGGVK